MSSIILFLSSVFCLLSSEEYPRISVEPPHSFPYKGIYLNYIAGYHIDRYIDKINNSEINCIVVDFKNAHGFVTYNTEVEFAEEIGAKRGNLNLEKLSKICENNGIYLIGRIVLFQDSVLAFYNKGEFAIRTVDNKIWSDGHRKYWVDPYSKNVRDYNIEIAKDIVKRGVKEVQFDYVRFPSRSGRFTPYTLAYEIEGISKEQVIAGFLKEAREALSPMDVIIACDVYGYTLWLPSLKEEGQKLEAMADNVDIICPMLYPSHFHKNFMKSAIPFEREYNCIYKSLVKGKERIQNNSVGFVSYIQGFNFRSPNFGPQYIQNQIEAVEKADAKGYIVWNAGGNYKPLFELFKK